MECIRYIHVLDTYSAYAIYLFSRDVIQRYGKLCRYLVTMVISVITACCHKLSVGLLGFE